MKFGFAHSSEKGPRRENEDATLVVELGACVLLAVADGLGGHNGGRLASQTAIDFLEQEFEHHGSALDLERASVEIHGRIVEMQQAEPALREMATTLTAALVVGDNLSYAHCGDTRLILQRGNGIRRLTTDHTEAHRLLVARKLTQEEFDNYPRKNVLENALGIRGTPYIDTGDVTLNPGDRLFAMSDGIYGKLPLRSLKALSDTCESPDELVRAVVSEVERLTPDDNFTIACLFASEA